MTCNLASLSGAMYHGFEGAISTFGVYFPYLNLALKWSKEPGPPHVFRVAIAQGEPLQQEWTGVGELLGNEMIFQRIMTYTTFG